jgi:signal transduction histidine kinase
MPGVDGLALVRDYRANPSTKNIPIIVLSTKDDPAVKGQAFIAGANDYLVKLPDPIELIARIRYHSRAYLNELQREERTRELQQSREQFRLIVEGTNAIPFTFDISSDCFSYVGPQAFARLGFAEQQWKQRGFLDTLLPRERNAVARQRIAESSSGSFEFESTLSTPDGRTVELRWVINCEASNGALLLRGLLLDISNERQLERGLAQAQKLESVGRLAAGVAHEINTPVQFISDNVNFVRSSMRDVVAVVAKYRELQQAVQSGGDVATAAGAAAAAEKAADLDYLIDDIPKSLASTLEGLTRIATIVSSLKEFASPDSKDKAAIDLNHAIQSTLVIASNEYQSVAEVVTEFGELPPVLCFAGEMNQTILNLLINAAHAIAEVVKDGQEKGRLTVRTRLDGAHVEISISDTGPGIAAEIREKVFEPFFTTKDVGKGTGQGLTVARSVVVDKHGGSLHFTTESGHGTTFYIRLPVGG